VNNGNVPKDHNYLLTVDKPLVLPSDTKVRFLITSDDVIHSWFVPDFGWKKDAIPGYINTDWTEVPAKNEGTYYGYCAELCGKGHAFMPIEVKVVSKAEFKTWLADQLKASKAGPDLTPFANLDEAMKVGGKTFHGICAMCHGDQGQGGVGPKMAGNPFFTDAKNIDQHIHVVTHGLNAMPSFSGQLSPREIAGVITYERNAFGNNTGQMVQPADVAKIEQEK
jgi:cytochrome c oxidase subunit 2